MQLHCGLKHWGTNSEIIHAISSSPYGPYQYHDTAVSRFSHNPTVHAHNGTYHIFHIGNGDNSTTPVDCTTEATSHTRETRSAAPVNSGLMVSSSSSLYGPWSQIELQLYNTEGSKLLNCSWSNPAPFIHANGTTLLAFTAGYCHGHTEVLGIARADSWRGPYTLLSLEPLSKRPWDCLSNQQFEDPFLWYDHRGYHILSHGMCPTGVLNAKLLYSRDGVTWSLSKREPYHYTVHWSQGDSQTYIRLERPQLLFANDGSMRPVALFNGVEALGELSYTLARPIAQ